MKKQIAALTLALAASIFSMSAMADDHQQGELGHVHYWDAEHPEQYVKKVITKETCTTPGLIRYYCAGCEDVSPEGTKWFHEVVTNPLGHDFNGTRTVIKHPTCTEPGEAVVKCTRCDAVDTVLIPALIDPNQSQEEYHLWDEWVVEKQPTCFEEGLKVRWCIRKGTDANGETYTCGAKEEKAIPALTAEYVEVSKKLIDCYHMEVTYKCKHCNSAKNSAGVVVHPVKTKTVDVVSHAIAHTDAYILSKWAPSCEKPGFILYKCKYYDTDNDQHFAHGTHVISDAIYGKGASEAAGLKNGTYGDGVDLVQIPAAGHKWGKWIQRHAPGEQGNKEGYWVRSCTVCQKTQEWISVTAPSDSEGDSKPIDPVPAGLNGLNKDKDGVYRYYVNGKVDTTKTGIVPFEGGEFFVANGVLCSKANGLNQNVDGKWYFLSEGRIVRTTDIVSYDDHFFKITNGELDEAANGIFDYDGGKFLFTTGRLRSDVQGLWQDPKDGTWYFLANGQVQTQYKGLALYDGHWFYVDGGKFDPNFAGKVEHDGKTFDVVNGQVF